MGIKNNTAEVDKISRRAAAMARACGLDVVDAAILLCSLLSLKGEKIGRTIYSRRTKDELYEDAKRLLGRGGDVGGERGFDPGGEIPPFCVMNSDWRSHARALVRRFAIAFGDLPYDFVFGA